MANWQELLDHTDPAAHFVQLYTDEDVLARNAGRYLATGIQQGNCAIAIATPEHRAAFREEIRQRGVDPIAAERDRTLLFLDAEQTLSRFMVDGRPDWARFEKTISAAVRQLARPRGVRAYGEMVGILWTSGEYSAAIRLEDFWNRILGTFGASLFCAYPIDVFGLEFKREGVHAILCDHTHLLPGEVDQSLVASIRRAMKEVLGAAEAEVIPSMDMEYPAAWGRIPPAQGMILWLRERFPDAALEILSRARRYGN